MKTKSKPASLAKVIAPPDYAVLNAALEQELDLAWTAANQARLKRRVGPVNFAKLEEIISFVSNQEAWLNDPSLSSAADKVEGKLSQYYPSLSPGAIFKVVNQATYGWR